MLRLNDMDSVYLHEELAGYTKKWVEDGLCHKQVDLLLLGFAYAVRKRLRPLEKIKRHDLLRVGALHPDMRLAVEAVAPWYARELGDEPPACPRTLLDFSCRLGSAGLKALKEAWTNKTKGQIELAILRMISDKSQAQPTTGASY